jgi:hypothetical protein
MDFSLKDEIIKNGYCRGLISLIGVIPGHTKRLHWVIGLILWLILPASWANVGSVVNILGNAKIQKKTGQTSPAIRGDFLYEGDAVWTEATSNVQIRMIDGAMVWVRPSSELKIDAYKSIDRGGARNESSLRLLSGSMRTVTGVIAKQSPENYRLNTPNATIGVRGTEFDAVYVNAASSGQYRAESGTYHRVYQGSTNIRSGQQEINVSEGQAVFMGTQSNSSPVRLQNIPDFLNLPPAATSIIATPANNVVIAQDQIRILVRYGSTNARSGETSVQFDNGRSSWVPVQRLMGQTNLLIGSDVVESNRLNIAITASRPLGSKSSVRLLMGDMQFSGRKGVVEEYRTSLELPAATWVEVTDRGPWQAVKKAIRASSSRYEYQQVFIMAE